MTSKRNRKVESEQSTEEVVADTQSEQSVAEPEVPKKKSYYNPVTAKAYRERLKQFAVAGGYVPKERTPGTGQTEKRTSKTGTTYYYQPWSTLTPEQKAKRLAQARERMARDRADAKKYREEHSSEDSK